MRRKVINGLAAAVVIACLLSVSGYARTTSIPQDTPVEETIPFKRQSAPASGLMPRVALVLLLSLGVGIGSMVLIKRNLEKKGFIRTGSGSRIVISEAKRVSPKLTVFLVSVDDKGYLLVQNGEQTTITQHSANIVMEDPDAS